MTSKSFMSIPVFIERRNEDFYVDIILVQFPNSLNNSPNTQAAVFYAGLRM